jgi:hypothetical protein
MKVVVNQNDLNIVLNSEQVFRTDLGWQDNLAQFENEVLRDIINPADNYETVRYIHKPYDRTISGITLSQTDIWYQFFFLSGDTTPTYVQEYEAVGITTTENEFMLRQSTESFFRLEFYKTPQKLWNNNTKYILNEYVNYSNKKYKCVSASGSTNNTPPISGTTDWWTFISENEIVCEPPTNQNKRLVFAKNLSIPLGEKFFYRGDTFGYYIHLPVFMGSNYRNKENMYLFWFEDETVLEESNLIGISTLDKYIFNNTGTTTSQFLFIDENQNGNNIVLTPSSSVTLYGVTGQTFDVKNISYTVVKRPDGSPIIHGVNSFFMSPRFFNAKDGSIIDFTNTLYGTGHTIVQQDDLYFQVDFDNYERTYEIYEYSNGTKGDRVGHGFNNSIKFYEKGGGIGAESECDFSGGLITYYVAPTHTPTATPSPTNTPTPTPTTVTTGCHSWEFVNNETGSTLYVKYIPCGESFPRTSEVLPSPQTNPPICVSDSTPPYKENEDFTGEYELNEGDVCT